MAPVDDAYKWTIDEYVLRCEQAGESLKEVVVEGKLDRDFVLDAFRRWELSEVEVRDAEFLSLKDHEMTERDATGVKATLVALALALLEASKTSTIQAKVRVVVDRDYDDNQGLGEFALTTDGYSMESYAFDPVTLDRFVKLLLGRGPDPDGGDSQQASRATVDGVGIYDRLLPAAIGLGAARLIVRSLDPPVSLIFSWDRYVSADSKGTMSIDVAEMIRNGLTSGGQADSAAAALDQIPAKEAEVAKDPFRLVRGHDFVRLTTKLLRSTWGRKISQSFHTLPENLMARQLLVCVDGETLDSTALFSSLRSTFSTAGP